MSGGFFRGTSADQDTRFSNKQAKLMKTQKFAPELEHLVDVSKVKMDVVKPWIANRVTEILGFEDEVLINFIYGLLDGKVVNGKEVQIQITGFMEKNTGKFMKELWNLLLSAQKNASGVPQQFLDAKEEEIRKKKVETDRITQEIQRKKELEHEKQKKMDDEAAILKAVDDASKPVRKHSSAQSEDDKGSGERNGVRGKNRSSRSPHSVERSPSPDRIPRSRSMNRSFSNSRSYSDDRHKSRSMSRSPQPRGRSISSDRQYRSPRKRTLSPRRKYSPRRPRSPIRRRSPYSRRRPSPYSYRRSPSPGSGSPSPVLRGSPSLRRRRPPTPVRRRSPSPVRRRRSPSPVRRRRSPSPVRRRRSPSPVRRRRSPSPMRRRSPLPMRRRSPLRRRSPPPRRRSPIATRRRSPSPSRYLSPPRRNSPSPLRRSPTSPRQRRRSPFRPPRQTYRSGSPHRSRSPAHRRRRSPSRDDDIRTNGMGSRRYRDDYVSERTHGRKSPFQGLDPVTRQPPISLRSPQRDSEDGSDAHRKMPISRVLSPSQSGSSLHTGKSSPSEDRSQSEGPTSNTREQVTRADSASPVRQTRHSISEEGTRYSRRVDAGQRTESPQRRTKHSGEAEHSTVDIEMRRRDRDKKSKQASTRTDLSLSPTKSPHMIEAVEHNPGRVDIDNSLPNNTHVEQPSAKQQVSPSPKRLQTSYSREDHKVDEKHSSGRNVVDSGLDEETEHLRKSMKRVHSNSTNRTATLESDSEDEKNKSNNMERKKHKRKDRHHMASDDDTSYDSHIDERKEAKRRKKEEKKLRKEEKRRRREEKRRRKEQRHAGKLKAKTMDTSTPPSDVEKKRSDADDSGDHVAAKIDFHPSDTEETESEQKRLEIQLRKKALESLRAKKAINP